jgi:Type I phosphodiesterase / nucleotide pyrophosphatase
VTDAPSREGTIASLTPTVCRLFRVPAPALADEPALASVVGRADRTPGKGAVARCLVYCPDALGDHLWSRFPERAAAVAGHCPRRVRLSSVVPPVTPVCFASVFTGASPRKHGVRTPDRSVLAGDTLFDALIRAGKRVAISAVRGSSIDRIFRERPIDFFSADDDRQATDRALHLLAADAHDLIVVYHQEYDDQLHRTEPFSAECLRAFANHVESVGQLGDAAREAWRARSHAVIVAPDHGAHADPETGAGDHGLDIPEDMEVSHWYGLRAAVPEPGPSRPA